MNDLCNVYKVVTRADGSRGIGETVYFPICKSTLQAASMVEKKLRLDPGSVIVTIELLGQVLWPTTEDLHR